MAVTTMMTGRDPAQPHRASTPLELLFDLCFVVAVSQAAAHLHHDLAAGHVADGIGAYLSVFFAIWWAWMNFTWFASAYDTDDVPYRLLTLLQIVGVLILASGVDLAFDGDFKVITIGYIFMRVAMVAQWLRAAAQHEQGRAVARRYAFAIFVIQLGWIGRLFLPDSLGYPSFVVLVAIEILIPIWTERTQSSRTSTPWHPEHIAERYGLFTIIVLGECILSAFVALNSAIAEGGVSGELVLIAIAALLAMFGLWWTYFRMSAGEMLAVRPHLAFIWGYIHYGLFASIAAFGAGIAVAAEWSTAHGPADDPGSETAGHFALGDIGTALTIGIPIAATMLILAVLRTLAHENQRTADIVGYGAAGAVLVASLLAGTIGVPASVLAIGVIVAAKVAADLIADSGSKPSAPVVSRVS